MKTLHIAQAPANRTANVVTEACTTGTQSIRKKAKADIPTTRQAAAMIAQTINPGLARSRLMLFADAMLGILALFAGRRRQAAINAHAATGVKAAE